MIQKQINHKDIDLAPTAAEPFGGFSGLKPGRRKSLTFDLIKRLELLIQINPGGRPRRTSEADLRANPAVADEIARRKRLGIAILQSLQRLTGKQYVTLKSWKRWRAKWKKKNPWK